MLVWDFTAAALEWDMVKITIEYGSTCEGGGSSEADCEAVLGGGRLANDAPPLRRHTRLIFQSAASLMYTKRR